MDVLRMIMSTIKPGNDNSKQNRLNFLELYILWKWKLLLLEIFVVIGAEIFFIITKHINNYQ